MGKQSEIDYLRRDLANDILLNKYFDEFQEGKRSRRSLCDEIAIRQVLGGIGTKNRFEIISEFKYCKAPANDYWKEKRLIKPIDYKE